MTQATLVKTIRAKKTGDQKSVAIVVSRFNAPIGERLVEGAVKTLIEAGVSRNHIEVAWVPGAWEIPVVAAKVALLREFQGIVALGAIIQGETSHHEYLAGEVAASLRRLTEKTGLPVAFGLLTTPTTKLALARAGKKNNKGAEAAAHLLEVLSVLEQV